MAKKTIKESVSPAEKPDNLPRYTIARYGWKPDLPDHRDLMYAAPLTTLKQLPSNKDLRKGCPPVYDQGQLGSCTANAIGAAFQFARMKAHMAPDFQPSRLFIYYNERLMEGTVNQDSGAQIRDGIKSVAKQGVCPETLWPYDPSPYPPNPRLALHPTPECYRQALGYQVVQYRRIPRSLNQMKGCLAAGFPFVYGFTVYESFESPAVAASGDVPMPNRSEEAIGGHAVLAVGYDDSVQKFIVRNSWGTGWGLKGYFLMPYAYLLDDQLADDFWEIQLVEE
jgi:C1A family cysteine protease